MKKMKERSIPEKLRAADFSVNTAKGRVEEIKQEDKDEASSTNPMKFDFEKGFKPTQPHRRGIPYQYRDRFS